MELLLTAGLYLFVMFVALAFVFQRLQWRRRRHLKRKDLGFFPTSTSLGNALHKLQSIAEPPAKYVITETLDEEDEAEGDELGSPSNAKAHLLSQAKRISRGERMGRLTAIAEGQNEGLQMTISPIESQCGDSSLRSE